jgi:hypothetical protein
MTMAACAAIFERYKFAEPAVVAAVLLQHAGAPPAMAMKLAKLGGGIPLENAPAPQAEAVATALAAAGHPARVIPQEKVPPRTMPRRVHVLTLDGDALGLQLKYSGPPEWIEWRDVLVISAGAITKETVKTITHETRDMHGGLHLDQRTQVDLQRQVIAELYADSAHGTRLVHIRLSCHEVNYAKTLGATIHETWREKFSVLLAKLGMKSERASISPQTEALLAAGMVPSDAALDPYFATEDDFAAYNRWLLCRHRLGWREVGRQGLDSIS